MLPAVNLRCSMKNNDHHFVMLSQKKHRHQQPGSRLATRLFLSLLSSSATRKKPSCQTLKP